MRIFLSYRREDFASSATVGRLRESLSEKYGEDNVFVDVDEIKPGEDFREVLGSAVKKCDVFLPMIGPQWSQILKSKEEGNDDFVVIEIESALTNNKQVIPILLGGSRMPQAQILPKRIRELSYKNAFTLDVGRNYKYNVLKLINSINYILAQKKRTQKFITYKSAAEFKGQQQDYSQTASSKSAPLADDSATALILPVQDNVAEIVSGYKIPAELMAQKSTRIAVAVILVISLACGLYFILKGVKNSNKESNDGYAQIVQGNQSVRLLFSEISIANDVSKEEKNFMLSDAEGKLHVQFTVKDGKVQTENIPIEVFDSPEAWPLKLEMISDSYIVPAIYIKRGDIIPAGEGIKRYGRSLDLKPLAYTDFESVINCAGLDLAISAGSFKEFLYPLNSKIKWDLSVKNNGIRVILPAGQKFPVKAVLSIPGMTDLTFSLKHGIQPRWNIDIARRKVQLVGLGEFESLKFIPDFSNIPENGIKKILQQNSVEYVAKPESFEGGRGAWMLPDFGGRVHVTTATGVWTFNIGRDEKFIVLTKIDQNKKFIDNRSVSFMRLLSKARNGDIDSQCELALAYLKGEGVSKNASASTEWFRMAADQGDKAAMHNMGVAYAAGTGVPVNEREAMRWYGKAAKAGYADSQVELGIRFHQGRGVPKNYPEAENFLGKAAAQGDERAMFSLALLYSDKSSGLFNEAKAMEAYQKAAAKGYPPAMYNLAWYYVNGEGGLAKDIAKAKALYQKAAGKGYARAKEALDELK